MAVVLRLDGLTVDDVVPVVSPLAELQAALHALSEPDHHFDARAWIQRTSAVISEPLRSELSLLAPLWARRRSRALLPLGPRRAPSFDDEVDALSQITGDAFFEAAAHTVHGGSFDTRGLARRPAEHAGFVDSCERRAFSRGVLARRLVEDPTAFREHLTSVLVRCQEEFFAEEWSSVRGVLQSAAVQFERALERSVGEALHLIGPRVTLDAASRSARIDKLQQLTVTPGGRPVLLVPSRLVRPHLTVRADAGWPVVLQFPISGTVNSTSLAGARDKLAVLADPHRLDVCRHLLHEAISTSDLAARTGMTAPQVSRHLARLREVGLLLSEREGRFVYHRLDTQSVIQLGPEILRSITY